ncbi:hypothetical protein SOVF_092010 [Spinacia oleracea]|nr:hypothetical protein SOVF_092010 [Spinacia oleracea]
MSCGFLFLSTEHTDRIHIDPSFQNIDFFGHYIVA